MKCSTLIRFQNKLCNVQTVTLQRKNYIFVWQHCICSIRFTDSIHSATQRKIDQCIYFQVLFSIEISAVSTAWYETKINENVFTR